MKDYLEKLEIGESKIKLSTEEIKGILTEHGKSVTTETDKVKQNLTVTINEYESQLKTANDTIKSYKDMDIDSIKKSASDWETKYNDEENFKKFYLKVKDETKTIPNLNDLEHGNSFCNDEYNGYDLSYLSIRYLNDILNPEDFRKLMSDFTLIKEFGKNIVDIMFEYYDKKILNTSLKK